MKVQIDSQDLKTVLQILDSIDDIMEKYKKK